MCPSLATWGWRVSPGLRGPGRARILREGSESAGGFRVALGLGTCGLGTSDIWEGQARGL